MMFWYLATPYSKYPDGLEVAFQVACRAAADLLRSKVDVFSPIAHSHPIAMHGGLDQLDLELWLPFNKPFMAAAKGLIVLRALSWERSDGVGMEIAAFKERNAPIVYMDPGVVPVEFRYPSVG